MGKFIVGTIGMIVITIVAFIGLRVFFCGPDQADLRVMKPMAEAISDYIIKNKIEQMPKSLVEIPNLPYMIKNCRKDYTLDRYKCNFISKDRIYEISYRQVWDTASPQAHFIYLRIYQYQSETGVEYDLKYDKKLRKWIIPNYLGERHKSIRIYDNKTSGICNPMRQ
jgi:hypothetical protein